MNHSVWTTSLMRMLLCAAALTLTACGGDDDPPPQALIGAAGGTAAGPNGAQVVVPASALAADSAIAVAQSGSGNPAPPASHTAVGAVYAFTPHGQSFALPVTISVPFDPALVPAGAQVKLFKTTNGAAGPWQGVPGATIAGNLISGQVTDFSLALAAVGNVAPLILTEPANAAVVEPQTASFGVTAVGTAPLSYQWHKSDDGGTTFGAINGATTNPYTTGATTVAADNGDRYRVVVSNLEGSTQSVDVTLTVTMNAIAPTITTQPQSVNGAIGNANFSVVATGTNLVYQWYKNGVPIAGQTNASLNLVNVQASDAGSYTVVVSNLVNGAPVNSVTSNPATLTLGVTPPTSEVARIAAGSDFSLARKTNGNASSWGADNSGTLGAGVGDQSRNVPGGIMANGITPAYTALAAGGAHGLGVTGLRGVQGWGYNGFGQLGNGNNLSREVPVDATWNDNGTARPYNDAVEVCGGTIHSLVRRSNGTVYAMGANNFGQIGDGTPADPSSTGRLRGVPVVGISTAIAIACRGNHSLALLQNGTVLAWGWNNAGQLGDGTTVDRNVPVLVPGLSNIKAIAAGSEHSLALDNAGKVWAWGRNVNGRLGDGTLTDRLLPSTTLLTSQITAIAAGYQNSVALRNDGVVLSWGINETGQLGSGSLSPGFRPQPAPVINLAGVVAIAFSTGGLSHGMAVKSDGTVWTWGDNGSGQLGSGSTAPFSATPVQVTGLNLN